MKKKARSRIPKALGAAALILLTLFLMLPYLFPLSAPAAAHGEPPFENSAFRQVNGISFHYRIYPARGPQPGASCCWSTAWRVPPFPLRHWPLWSRIRAILSSPLICRALATATGPWILTTARITGANTCGSCCPCWIRICLRIRRRCPGTWPGTAWGRHRGRHGPAGAVAQQKPDPD